MQGGPAKNFLTPPNSNLQQRFVDAGFKSVLFQEYSDKFPHKKYTVGYAGRPGGPDFYISMKDNSRLHGPGGQSSYEDPSEADPCFAKVIEGTDVAERMKLGQVKPGKYKALEDNVAIVSMRILSDNEGGVQVPDHVHDLPEGMDKNEGNEHVPDHVHDLPDGMEAESNK
jgi:cyclophilin family peptidyl-prolyl cis-trans isomerase